MKYVAVAGNPNCGKSTLFNALTGARQKIGNWPGVTVESKRGYFTRQGTEIELVDLPGLYSLDPGSGSVDVNVTRDYLFSGESHLILNVVDASNLERHLYLTTQLIELGLPMVLALNFMDMGQALGQRYNLQRLEEHLGIPVVPLVASQGKGLQELKDTLLQTLREPRKPHLQIHHAPPVEEALQTIEAELVEKRTLWPVSARSVSTALLSGEPSPHFKIPDSAIATAQKQRKDVELALAEDIDIILADARYDLAHKLANETVTHRGHISRTLSDRIDSIVLNRFLALPIFLLIMFLMFTVTINIGGALVDFFDQTAGVLLVDGLGSWLERIHSPQWLIVLLANGLGGGIQVVATFIPIIGLLYLFLSFLEDSGYMSRVAFIMDRFMRSLGLPGKAFVPLIVGFGCNVPAIMAARTLDSPRERIMTVMMSPFMSCGARLSVYALFAAAFFKHHGGTAVMALYLIGIAAALLTALLLKHTLLPGRPAAFIMELPNYHMPSIHSVLIHAWHRLKGFLFDAGKIIIIMVMIINVANTIGTDGSFGNEDSENSVLSVAAKAVTPLFAPLGISEDNWPATVGIFTGVLAKEVVVGTLDTIYADLDKAGTTTEATSEPASIGKQLLGAAQTIPDNLGDAFRNLADPLGLRIIAESGDENVAAASQSVQQSTFGAMVKLFDGEAGAFAYLLFVLLYFPCASAFATIYRETSAPWAVFIGAWSLTLGFSLATLFYQTVTYRQHPGTSLAWILGLSTVYLFIIFLLRLVSKDERKIFRQQAQT